MCSPLRTILALVVSSKFQFLRLLAIFLFINLNFYLQYMHGNGFLKIIVLISFISLLLDWYVYSGLRTLAANWKSQRRRKIVLRSYWIISVSATILLLIKLPAFRTANGMRPINEWILSIFLVFFITKLFFVIILLIGDLSRLFAGIFRKIAKPGNGPAFPARRKFISEIAILIAALPFTSFLYAMIKGKYDYRLYNIVLYFDELPTAFDGFTITQISDVHSGSFDHITAVQKGIDMVNAQKSD